MKGLPRFIIIGLGLLVLILVSLVIWDLLRHKEIELVGSLGGGIPWDVFVQGDYAYVAANSILSIVDIRDPKKPVQISYCGTPDDALGVYISGSYAYVATCKSGLRIVDVSNPASPREVGYCDTPGEAQSVYVSGSYAYVTDGESGLRIISRSQKLE